MMQSAKWSKGSWKHEQESSEISKNLVQKEVPPSHKGVIRKVHSDFVILDPYPLYVHIRS